MRNDDLLKIMKETLYQIAEEGKAYCRFCGFQVEGKDWDEILEKLGKHAEEAHGNQFLFA